MNLLHTCIALDKLVLALNTGIVASGDMSTLWGIYPLCYDDSIKYILFLFY